MLSLSFLGAPRIERDGQLVLTDTRKAVALAAYLALTQVEHNREELAALFYPDAEPARARGALRRTLSALRSALGGVLETDRERVRLNTDRVHVDVLEFRQLVASAGHAPGDRAALARAAQLYRGDLLAGFTLRDSPGFDEWQFFETESLRKQLAHVLEQLVALERARGNFKRAIEYARRWLALDALHEPAHRALMELYTRDGQRAAALRQYHECVRLLDKELGVAPLPETAELFRAINEQRLAPLTPSPGLDVHGETPPAPVPLTLPAADFPLVGRTAELAALQHAYHEIGEQGRLLVIQGEAGIGKTRLAQEFLARVSSAGARILTARSYPEQRTLAYAPVVHALHAALSEAQAAAVLADLSPTTRADAARLLPELALQPTTPLPEETASQARFIESVTQLVLACAGGIQPGVLFFDDVQWLDKASLDLLAFLIRRLRTAPLCILLTWRPEELPSDHALRRVYADALREGRARLVTLGRLERPQVNTLLRAAAARGAPIDSALGERLYVESEGQPFFLIEALKFLEREGELPAGDGLPASVRELLHSRLAPLSETARQVLGSAAVLGHSFDPDIVRAASGRSEEETVAALEELGAQGLVVEASPSGIPRYDFAHDKLRALVYEETTLARRRLLHRRAGDALAHQMRGHLAPARTSQVAGQLAGQVAQHYRAAGADALAAEYSKLAGDHARAVFANREAVEHYTAALALGHPDGAALHRAIGLARTLLGEYDLALTALEAAAAFGAADTDALIAQVYLRRGEWQRAARHLQQAVNAADDPAVQARLYADLALADHRAGESGTAAKVARRALQLARRAQDPGALALAHNVLGILARAEGSLAQAAQHLAQSVDLATRINDAPVLAAALNNLALVMHDRDDNPRALALTGQALALAVRDGDRHREAALHNHLADLFHACGKPADSMAHLKQAVTIYAEIGGAPGAWQPEIWKLAEW